MGKMDIRVGSYASLLTVHDVAGYLRLSEAKVYRMVNAGLIPGYRVGKSWRFKREKIDEWLNNITNVGNQKVDEN